MTRRTGMILTVLSLIGAFLFYFYVPVLWQIDYTWHIHASENVTKERVLKYHHRWLERMESKNIHQFVREKNCRLTAPIWQCAYIASNYQDFRKLRFEALHGYKKISGWVEPLELKQKLQHLNNQKIQIQQTYNQSDKTIKNIRKALAPKQDKIDTWAYEKNLLTHNLSLRKNQLALYSELLPQMSSSSTLYNLYIDQSFGAKKRIRQIEKRLDALKAKFKKTAPQWLVLETLMQQRDMWIQDQKKIDQEINTYQSALTQNKFGKVPHPLEYAFFLESENNEPVRQTKVLVPAFLSLLLILANLWLLIQKAFLPEQNTELS